VRDVRTDTDTFLNYARKDMLAFVMFFSQPRTDAGEAEMQAMTVELVDAVLEAGGRYYLPYRLHATSEQFRRAYPQADEFFSLKRKYDPQELFQNQFYRKYGITPVARLASSQ
jgi:FAD/FMN-containing dehydrogenase